ncbi:MAG TPA: MFS transporter [Gemmatimonadales bacterium]|nr:MFS transporter [Gemmatimonadales bacterium]
MTDHAPARWRRLALLAVAVVGGMSTWFAGSAAAPLLAADLALTPGEVGWLASAVQLGFVAGTLLLAITNLADLLPGRRLFALSAIGAALSNAALLQAHGVGALAVSRLATGLFLAGVYPPAMKMAATWFRSARGIAIGTVVGALTVGKAVPYLLEGGSGLSLATIVIIPSIASCLAAFAIFVWWQDGPHAFPSRPFAWGLVAEAFRVPGLRRVTAGYLGHMWELYAFWAWVPGFLAAASLARGEAPRSQGAMAFGVLAVGAIGCIGGGWLADRVGRRAVARGAMLISGSLAALSPLLFAAPRWLLIAGLLLWGMAVIADSAQFSALATELAPPHAVGTALALQTSLGFLLTIVSIQLVPIVVDAIGWQWGLAGLAVGPLVGAWVLRRE